MTIDYCIMTDREVDSYTHFDVFSTNNPKTWISPADSIPLHKTLHLHYDGKVVKFEGMTWTEIDKKATEILMNHARMLKLEQI
jgi:hypothetical protein